MQEQFRKRRQASWARCVQILSTVLRGGGAPIFVGLLLLTCIFAYQTLINSIPTHFPIRETTAIILAILLSWTRLRTWIQTGDLTFLLPFGNRMSSYFRASFQYSLQTSLLKWVGLSMVLYPLYSAHIGEAAQFWLLLAILLCLQIFNLLYAWNLAKLRLVNHSLSIQSIQLGIILINLLPILGLFYQQVGLSILFLFFHVATLFGLYQQTRTIPYPWRILQQQEQSRRGIYLRMASWFVDVAETEIGRDKKRMLRLNPLRVLPQSNAYLYLYIRSFLRTKNPRSVFGWLQLWVLMILYAFPNPWVALCLIWLSLWLSATQIASLHDTGRYPIWPQLYPLPSQQAVRSLSLLMMGLLAIQAFLLTFVLFFCGLFTVVDSMLILLSSWAIGAILSFFYSQK